MAAPARMTFDTFDTLRSGEPTVVEVLGRTHSRMVQWLDFDAATLAGDLVGRWEQPDALTWVFHMRPGVRWQDRAPVNGRELGAGDVLQHFSRATTVAADPAQPVTRRDWDYGSVRRVTSPAAGQVVFEMARPDPFLLNTLAGRFALVQAPEAVEAFAGTWQQLAPGSVVGSGAFELRTIRDDGTVVLDGRREGAGPPFVDGIEVSQPDDVVDRFLGGRIDEAITRDRRDADGIRQKAGAGVTESVRFEDSPVVSTVFIGSPPWNNLGLLRAISAALNRDQLIERLFGGRAEPSGPVPPVVARFAPDRADRARFPGYRTDRSADQRDAAALWQASAGAALGAISVDFPSVFDPLYSASSIVTGMLNDTLGAQFRPAVETYTTVSAKAVAHRYGSGTAALWFGWAPPFSDPEPSRYLIETFYSGGPGAAASGYHSDDVDRLLDTLSVEFDLGHRADLIRQVNTRLLEDVGGGVLPWVVQRSECFRRPYLGRSRNRAPFWPQHLDAQASLDRADPSFGVRWGES